MYSVKAVKKKHNPVVKITVDRPEFTTDEAREFAYTILKEVARAESELRR